MPLDPLEKERLRRKMAVRMQVIAESAPAVACVSAHFNEEPAFCELCQEKHATGLAVIRNRAGKNFHVATECLLEMVRFKVIEVQDLPRWLEKLKELKAEFERRKVEQGRLREEERRRLEKKFIVRKREPESAKA